MNKEDRREYNKLAKRKQCQCFDQSLASSSSIKRDFQITPSSGKKNSLCQDLLTKYLHKNINQQWTKEIWEDTSQWESNDTKHHQKVEIMKKSTQKRKSSTRIRVSSTRSSAAKVLCDSANDPANEGDSYVPESGPPPLESNKDTQLDDTQPENIQDSESSLTATDTTPLSKKRIFRAKCHFLPHLPTNAYDSLKVFRQCYIRLGKDNNLII